MVATLSPVSVSHIEIAESRELEANLSIVAFAVEPHYGNPVYPSRDNMFYISVFGHL